MYMYIYKLKCGTGTIYYPIYHPYKGQCNSVAVLALGLRLQQLNFETSLTFSEIYYDDEDSDTEADTDEDED